MARKELVDGSWFIFNNYCPVFKRSKPSTINPVRTDVQPGRHQLSPIFNYICIKNLFMKKLVFSLLFLSCAVLSYAQQEINIVDAAKHEGDSVTICTKIFGARYFEDGKGAPTLLNAGAKYPDAPLTVVIFGENRAAFANKPELFYVDKNVCVTGRITMFKGKPQIVLTKETDIIVKP